MRSMGWQEEAAAVRDAAMGLLRGRGEWVAPPTFGQVTIRVQKVTAGEFRMELYAFDEKSGPSPEKPYRLQIWWQGQQVAHLEWTAERGPVNCRAFKRGEWRDELMVLRP